MRNIFDTTSTWNDQEWYWTPADGINNNCWTRWRNTFNQFDLHFIQLLPRFLIELIKRVYERNECLKAICSVFCVISFAMYIVFKSSCFVPLSIDTAGNKIFVRSIPFFVFFFFLRRKISFFSVYRFFSDIWSALYANHTRKFSCTGFTMQRVPAGLSSKPRASVLFICFEDF
jgi:hypothetical protein